MKLPSALAATAFLALLCAGCTQSDPDAEPEWHGTVRRACGPADGPALQIAMDTAAYAACTTSHAGEARIYTDAWSFDSLVAGKVLELSGPNLCTGGCGGYAWDYLRLEVISKDPSLIVVRFHAQHQTDTGKFTPVSGTVLLRNCAEAPLHSFCG